MHIINTIESPNVTCIIKHHRSKLITVKPKISYIFKTTTYRHKEGKEQMVVLCLKELRDQTSYFIVIKKGRRKKYRKDMGRNGRRSWLRDIRDLNTLRVHEKF